MMHNSSPRFNPTAGHFHVLAAHVKVTRGHLILGWGTVKVTAAHFNLRTRTVALDRRSLSFVLASRESAPSTLKSAPRSHMCARARATVRLVPR
jgi:hypothetical protein